MSKNDDKITIDNGVVKETLRGGMFSVEVPFGDSMQMVTAYLSGKIRKNEIRIVPGDIVTIEMSPFDLTKGRIIYRSR
jgi:translation initiation factor IF-1